MESESREGGLVAGEERDFRASGNGINLCGRKHSKQTVSLGGRDSLRGVLLPRA